MRQYMNTFENYTHPELTFECPELTSVIMTQLVDMIYDGDVIHYCSKHTHEAEDYGHATGDWTSFDTFTRRDADFWVDFVVSIRDITCWSNK